MIKKKLNILAILSFLFMSSSIAIMALSVEKEEHYTTLYYTDVDELYQEMEFGMDETIILPRDPEKDGFIFDGWYQDQDHTIAIDKTKAYNEDISFYAKWVEDRSEYTILFMNYDGTPFESVVVKKGGTAVSPDTSLMKEKLGYHFDSWDKPLDGIYQDQVVKPILAPNVYKVKYDFVYPDFNPVYVDTKFEGPFEYVDLDAGQLAQKPNFEIVGWRNKLTGKQVDFSSDILTVAGEIELAAIWGIKADVLGKQIISFTEMFELTANVGPEAGFTTKYVWSVNGEEKTSEQLQKMSFTGDVGTYNVSLSITQKDSEGNLIASGYTQEEFIINPKQINIELGSLEKIYDGNVYSQNLKKSGISDGKNTFDWSASISTSSADVATYTSGGADYIISQNVQISDGHKVENYAFNFEGSIEIKKRPLVLTVTGGATSVYGESISTPTFTFEDKLAPSNPPCNFEGVIKLGTTATPTSKVGNEYEISVSSISDANYFVETINNKYYSITPATIVLSDSAELLDGNSSLECIFDNKDHVFSVSVAKPVTGATVHYKVDDGEFGSNPVLKKAKTYTITYYVTAENYFDTAQKTTQVTINKQKITINVGEQSRIYNGDVFDLAIGAQYRSFRDAFNNLVVITGGVKTAGSAVGAYTWSDGNLA
ncbi:MAG: InlB B-repeat-containing protein, partial [Clostridia bacterium]|nr:InlB B-repeat-containing protein [Clostridia bacterium]